MIANPADMRFFGAPRQTAPASQIVRATEPQYLACVEIIANAWTKIASGFKGQSAESVSRQWDEPTFVPVGRRAF